MLYASIVIAESQASLAAKSNAQRKLNYCPVSQISTNTESTGAAYHTFKYDSSDIPKRAHIQRYIQQLSNAEKPVREAWSENPSQVAGPQAKHHKSTVSHSPPGMSSRFT